MKHHIGFSSTAVVLVGIGLTSATVAQEADADPQRDELQPRAPAVAAFPDARPSKGQPPKTPLPRTEPTPSPKPKSDEAVRPPTSGAPSPPGSSEAKSSADSTGVPGTQGTPTPVNQSPPAIPPPAATATPMPPGSEPGGWSTQDARLGQTPRPPGSYQPSRTLPPGYAPTPGQPQHPPSALAPAASDPSANAWAQQDDGHIDRAKQKKNRTRLSLDALTRVPIDLGVQARLQTPHWVRVTLGAGVVPGAYLSIVNSVVEAAEPYGDLSGPIASGYHSGWSYNARLGIRPSAQAGLYLDAGYSKVQLSGQLDVTGLTEAVGASVAATNAPRFDIKTKLDLAMFEIGWEGHLGERVLLGLGLGLMVVMESETTSNVATESAQEGPAVETANEATNLLDSGIERYGFIPTAAVRLGYDML